MKSIKLFACLSIAIASLQACNKTDATDTTTPEVTTATQTIDVVVDQNGKYTVALPTNVSGYTISSDASHSSSSKIMVNNDNTETYIYEPLEGYAGTDAIVLTATDTTTGCDHPQGGGGGCHNGGGQGKGHGDCPNKGNDNNNARTKVMQQNINVNVTVTPTTTIPS